MTAAEFYEWVSSCVAEREALSARLESMRSRGSGGVPAVTRGGVSDPTARKALAALATEPAILRGLETCDRVMEKEGEAFASVSANVGMVAAMALRLHYRDGCSWDSIALEFGLSLSKLYRTRREAMAWLDGSGVLETFDGSGGRQE